MKPHNYLQSHCNAEGCIKPHRARGYCASHYSRITKHGTLELANEGKARAEERERIIKYLLAMKVIREGMLGGEYVAMDTTGENAVSLSTTLGEQ